MIGYRRMLAATLIACAPLVNAATAQPLGTFRWQLVPFCNVVTLAVTQNGSVYRLEGTDDQCGNGADAASATGTAFPNADGTIGFGLNIVTAPGGRPLHVDAEISPATFSGTWRDSAGASGPFAFTSGAGNGGGPRPLPTTGVPSAFELRSDGGFVAGGQQGVGSIPATGSGARMMWYPGKAAFRAGQALDAEWDDANVGPRSVALGIATRASGNASTAMGFGTTASGNFSTAMGAGSSASGVASTAMGSTTTASGDFSTAMGDGTTASGRFSTARGGNSTTASGDFSTAMGSAATASGLVSTAMGSNTTASGSASTAMGSISEAAGDQALAAGLRVTANGAGSVVLGSDAFARTTAPGTFLFGDRSTADDLVGTLPNQFFVRAAGGVVFHTNAALSAGVQIGPNGSQWLSFSDVNMKRDFRPLDGETVLAKLARMPVQEWSYKAQDPAIRHVGPTAQDFHAAFGLGEDPLRIGTLDADGVALAGVKALEARSREMREQHDALRQRVVELERALAEALDAVRALKGGGR